MEKQLTKHATGTGYEKEQPEKFHKFLARQRSVFIVAFVGYISAYLVRNNFKLMSGDMIDLYGWDKLNVSFLLTCFTITYGLGKFFMGMLADRISLRKLFAGALGISAIICILIGFSSKFALIAILLIICGLIQGALAPSSQAMLANYFPNKTRGAAIAGWNISQNIGSALLPLIISGLGFIAPNNILLTFLVPGLLVLIISFFLWRFGGDNPEKEGLDSLRKMYGKDGEPNVEEEVDKTMPYWQLIKKYVFFNPGILMVGLINAALYFVRFGIEDWMPIYLGHTAGFQSWQYLTAISVLEWIAVPGSLFFAWLAVKFPNKMTIVGAIGLFVMSGLVFVYENISYSGPRDYIFLLIISGLLGTLIYGPQLIVNILTLNFVPLKVAGTALGFVGLMAYLIGNLGSNWLMPILADHLSWTTSYFVVAGLAFLSGVGYLLLAKRERKAIKA
ncbi:MFS transporter [Agrilactobacillus yilanensis]|uniref:MFS transporter n=1 Tax=Agrilactobacillus yilanensis TaxID=2485997 RepID=A0ABW4J992_9LACO|nr:MFS transporter [Agrilactobacillus yilanensis]